MTIEYLLDYTPLDARPPRHMVERAQRHSDTYGIVTWIAHYKGVLIHTDFAPGTGPCSLQHIARITPKREGDPL